MNARFPQDDSQASLEGTAAHWAAWEQFAMRPVTEGMTAPNGMIVTGEMLDGGELLIDTIGQRVRRGTPFNIETPVKIKTISEKCFGTPDYWAFDSSRAHLEIVDYKFGHLFVDEYFNPQGISYLLGILAQLVAEDRILGKPEACTAAFTIVQPRCFYRAPVRTHSFVVREILPYLEKLQAAAQAALQPTPVARVNEHCTNCPGRHACPTLQQAAYAGAEYASERPPLELSASAAAIELRMMERALSALDSRVEGLREQVTANLRKGLQVPLYHLEPTRARDQWNVPIEHVIAMGQAMGKNLSKPGVMTPNQARKEGIDESVIKGYSISQSSMKLVEDNPSDARRVFGLIEGA